MVDVHHPDADIKLRAKKLKHTHAAIQGYRLLTTGTEDQVSKTRNATVVQIGELRGR